MPLFAIFYIRTVYKGHVLVTEKMQAQCLALLAKQ